MADLGQNEVYLELILLHQSNFKYAVRALFKDLQSNGTWITYQ